MTRKEKAELKKAFKAGDVTISEKTTLETFHSFIKEAGPAPGHPDFDQTQAKKAFDKHYPAKESQP